MTLDAGGFRIGALALSYRHAHPTSHALSSALEMTSFNNLPNELVIDIIKEVVPYNHHEPTIGVNAAWDTLQTYHDSLKIRNVVNDDNKDETPSSDAVIVSIYADLLSLRLTSSKLNSLCLPFVFKDLNVLRDLNIPFEDFYRLIVRPYGHFFRNVRIYLSDSINDEMAGRILDATTNVTDVLLYHMDFMTPEIIPNLNCLFEGYISPESHEIDWMHHTNTAILRALEERDLRSLGIYAEWTINNEWRELLDEIEGPLRLLLQILESPMAAKSLKKLDIAVYSISADVYDLLRCNLPSLTSLTIYHALRPQLGRLWDDGQQAKWNLSQNLTHLFFKKCATAYAPHIPHLVRHVPSLRHLLISMCGFGDDVEVNGPASVNWFSSPDALWRVRPPLSTLQFEYVDTWEMGAMGEIPTHNLILANTNGRQFTALFQDHPEYFPKLRVISIEPKGLRGYGRTQFNEADLKVVGEIGQKRGISIVTDAVPTHLWPSHFI